MEIGLTPEIGLIMKIDVTVEIGHTMEIGLPMEMGLIRGVSGGLLTCSSFVKTSLKTA
jgi:hypothetical protein